MTSRRVITSLSKAGKVCRRSYSSDQRLSNTEVTQKRNELFGREVARQRALVNRLEKIQVDFSGPPEECTLLMNKGISTPFNCTMHIQELLMTRSVLAMVNGQPWDMHRPLEDNCEITFLHFREDNPESVNEAFWRTGSFILGYLLEKAFKDEHFVELCSFPKPNLQSGSFIYDVDLKVPDWQPSASELNCLGRVGSRLGHEDLKFERLDVDASVALKIFEDNRFKTAQIPAIAAQSSSGNKITLYRMADHVDISRGPLISSTNLLGRFNVTAVHDIESPTLGKLQRVQGLGIPKQLPMHFWSYEILCKRSAQLNPAPYPNIPGKDSVQVANNG